MLEDMPYLLPCLLTPDFRVFTLNLNIVVNLVYYALRTRQVERFITFLDETEYAIFTVEVNEVRGFKIALTHIRVCDFGLQVRNLI